MESKYKVIDFSNSNRKNQYEWFSSFENPTYGMNVRIDVSEIVSYTKETNTSFFANFLYVITKAINEMPSMRLRVLDNKPVEYEVIHPSFTVKTEDGSFNNAGFDYSSNYQEFYERCRLAVDANNKETIIDGIYNDTSYDKFYSSCLTTIDIVSVTHPIKASDKSSTSVPRIFWDKYIKENDKYYLTLNITVSHALVDGEELSKTFNLVRDFSLRFKELIKQ